MQQGASSCHIGSEIQTSSMASDGQTANHHFHGKKTTQTRIPDHQPPKIVAVAHLRPQKAPTWCHKNCLKTSHWTFMVPVRNPPDFHSSMAFSMAIIHVKDIGCEAWGSLGS